MKKIKRARSPSPKRKSPPKSKSNFTFGRRGKLPFPVNSDETEKKKAYEELYNEILDIINKNKNL